MEEYVGKICPFCKTEITAEDEVIVCPECKIPHHKGCWEENKGCTTFGCKEQHYEAQHTNPTDVCVNCGAPIGDGQAFCPKCGTPKGGAKKNVCSKCGAELEERQEFCPKCGQKVGLVIDVGVNSAINQFNAVVNQANQKKKKKPAIIAIIAVAAVLVVLGVIFVPKLFKSAEDYMAMGNYEKAYSTASKSSEKDAVIIENNVAVCSSKCIDSLKDSKSFELRDAWCDYDKGYVVLKVAANNSYGNTVINHWLYYYSTSDQKWNLYDTYTDFDKQTEYSWDSADDKLEKAIHNLGLTFIGSTMTSSNKLSNAGVKRINSLFSEDLLYKVEQIEAAVPKNNESN